ncbi:MAG TPA: tRNA-dihydrouridine synthase [Patescibacteria group bacterium]|nr:tRNA-dihydrouridine synthase [Patescibacteria group bacterium]
MLPYLGFWGKLKKPFFVLAPMADVTDAAFRRIIMKYSRYGGRNIKDGSMEGLPAEAFRVGGPDVMWTEFVSADGLCHPDGRKALALDLQYTEEERPIVAQIFTANPDVMCEAAKIILELGFDGVDINMGCPEKNILNQGAGASVMKNPELAKALILAAREGVANKIPVSVKTRLGFNEDTLEDFLPKILEAGPAAITIHLRTKQEMSLVPAHWDRMKRAVEIAMGSGTLMIGNGDVATIAEARIKVKDTGCDGVMIGRGVFGNPWFFDETKGVISTEERLRVLMEHTKLYEELFSGKKSFALMKKHFKAYVHGFPEAKELRVKLMECQTANEVAQSVEIFLTK